MRPVVISALRERLSEPESTQTSESLDAQVETPTVSAMDRRLTQRPWLNPRRIVWVGLGALIVIIFGVLYARFGATRTLNVERDRLTVSAVRQGAFNDYIPVIGIVEPGQTVYLDAVDGGQIAEVLAEEGAMVSAGQPLIRLTNTDLQLQVISSEAQMSEQLNRLTSTKLMFEQSRLTHARELIDVDFQIDQVTQRLQRIEPLVGTGAIRRADVEDAVLERKRLQRVRDEVQRAADMDKVLLREQITQLDGAVRGLTANLNLARENLGNLIIKAPIAGQLTSLEAHLGESKGRGQRVGTVDQIDAFKVVALVDEHYLGRIVEGQQASADIGGEVQELLIAKVYPEVKERQFKIDLEPVKALPASIRRGQSLQLRLQIGAASSALLVANGAFYEDTGGQWAFVLSSSGDRAERRATKFGRRNPETVEVLEGLSVGDQVITSSYQAMKEFDRIELDQEQK